MVQFIQPCNSLLWQVIVFIPATLYYDMRYSTSHTTVSYNMIFNPGTLLCLVMLFNPATLSCDRLWYSTLQLSPLRVNGIFNLVTLSSPGLMVFNPATLSCPGLMVFIHATLLWQDMIIQPCNSLLCLVMLFNPATPSCERSWYSTLEPSNGTGYDIQPCNSLLWQVIVFTTLQLSPLLSPSTSPNRISGIQFTDEYVRSFDGKIFSCLPF